MNFLYLFTGIEMSEFSDYFSGAGDDIAAGTITEGNKLIFNMGAGDVSKSVVLQYTETVYLSAGYIIFYSSPLGAYIDTDVLDPSNNVVGSFGRKIPLLMSGRVALDVFAPRSVQINFKN